MAGATGTRRMLRLAAVIGTLLALGGCAAGTRGGGPAAAPLAAEVVPAERQIVVTVRNGAPVGSAGVGTTGRSYGALGRYEATPAATRDAAAIARRHGLTLLTAWPIQVLGVHCIVYGIDDAARPLDAVLGALRQDASVESAQPLQLFRPLARPAGDDPYASLQEGLASSEVEEAQRWTRGAGVRIAIIDSGIDDTHPELLHRVALARDFTGQARGPARLERHGTAVAGVIAANARNGQGIVGVAPEASVLALRACWQQGGEGAAVCNTLTLARALAGSLADGADVLNLSLAGPPDPLLERLVLRALAMGKVVVAAVPEEGVAVDGAFPASLPGVLAVASDGAEPPRGFEGALRAPGREVLTLRPGGSYDFDSGSSLAAAHVSGIVALLRALRPDLPAARVRALLEPGAPAPAGANGLAAVPVVNACRAVVALRGAGECSSLRRMRAARR